MKIYHFISILIVFFSCTEKKTASDQNLDKEKEVLELIKEDYELNQSTQTLKSVLVLFGGYPETTADIKREFEILDIAKENDIAVLFMNFNQTLWLEEIEKQRLAEDLQNIFHENELATDNIYFGGFSSGGNVALLISDFLSQQNSKIAPKGVFAIDSPIDLLALHKSSKKNIERNFSEISVKESSWIIETLEEQLGNPLKTISNYEKYSVYTSETNNFDNIKNLKTTKLRFYSEPDTLWWKENRMADFDQMNAFYLERLSVLFKKSNFKQVEYIATQNRGYRANGERHPHSWAIVDQKDLINWMME